jgi:hypothetical protein
MENLMVYRAVTAGTLNIAQTLETELKGRAALAEAETLHK